MKKAITIKDIAEQLGLSRNTVAKALNGQYVPPKTREIVIHKAKELNYKSLNIEKNEIAKDKKYRILLISGKPLNNIHYFVPIIKSIENYCYDHHYELFQYIFNKDINTFEGFLIYVKDFEADGILTIESFDKDFITKLIHLNKPICFVDFCTFGNSIEGKYDIVETNNNQPVFEITKYLIKKYGITKFCFVGDYKHCLSFQDRYHGMITALLQEDIAHHKSDDILRSDCFDYGNVNSIKTEILKLKHKPQCFICSNDFIARSVCNALKELNIKIPEAAMVVGYDNVSEAILNNPTITSIGIHKEQLGVETIKTLLRRIENPTAPIKRVIISPKIYFRSTTNRKEK